ncbi:DUF6493 family protein [Cellulomonas sp. NPDC057328]|uniref:DUF6493 family protein n=1 Tax=Cellulomonas sp. NPDC057328 TaxID=3346101 RepID=UPI00363443C6
MTRDHAAAAAHVLDRVRAGDGEAVVAALAGMTAAGRTATWRSLRPLGEPDRGDHMSDARWRVWTSDAMALARLGCAPASQAREALEGQWWDARTAELAAQVLADRDPSWLTTLDRGDAVPFRVLRALLRRGVLEPPLGDDYVLAAVHTLARRGVHASAVLDAVRADPGLVDDVVWRLLTTERAGRALQRIDEFLLAPTEQFGTPLPPCPEATWRHALVTLSSTGELDRDRLLDACLTALGADWSAADLVWFVRLHAALAPTLDETAARTSVYAGLVTRTAGGPVTVGLDALRTLERAGRLPPATFLAVAPAVLARSEKGSASAALRLLRALAAREPAATHEVVEVVQAACEHPHATVREDATRLLADLGAAPAAAAEDPGLPDTLPPDLPAVAPVRPVRDADELLELLVALVEGVRDPLALERAHEGVVRLRDAHPPVGAAAVVARARAVVAEFDPYRDWLPRSERVELARLVLVWLDGAEPAPRNRGRPHPQRRWFAGRVSDRSLGAAVARRGDEVARAVRTGGGALVSLPSGSDGSLDADVLAARLAAPGHRPVRHDVGLALLRVPAGQLDALGTHLAPSPEGAAALPLLRGWRPDWQRVQGVCDDAAPETWARAVAWQDGRTRLGRDDDLVALVLDRHDPLRGAPDEQGDEVTSWPWFTGDRPDLLASHAHPGLLLATSDGRSDMVLPVLDAFASTARSVGPPTCSALVLAAASGDGTVRIGAADAVAALASRGLLGGAVLGAQVRALVADGTVVGGRVVATLREAARAGAAAADVVLDALVAALPDVAGRRDAHLWVDAVAEVATARGQSPALPDALLARGRGSSALARAVRRVPGVPPSP